ncbi:WecB/TagA/CpsF family glycosyltransferase [Vibrio alginolyticus]|nr:WecB/TagA/CpsF family glycosyltransferase [Vibrio alginolyticus]
MLDSDDTLLFSFVNPYSYYIFEDNINESDTGDFTLFADGISLVNMNNFFNPRKIITRASFDFTSLAPIVFEYCVEKKLKLAIVGGNADEITKAIEVLRSRFLDLDIVYYRDGFFELDDVTVYDDINNARADFVLSGMGTPKQEQFLIQVKRHCPSLRIGFTCGGFLTQIASNPEYFSPLMNRLHLRWLQRFIRHSFVRKRVIFDYPLFFLKFAWQQVKFRNIEEEK